MDFIYTIVETLFGWIMTAWDFLAKYLSFMADVDAAGFLDGLLVQLAELLGL